MSYCRFSSDGYRSDVYVYADCSGGYTTHVAARKKIGPLIPHPTYGLMMGKGFKRLRMLAWRILYRLHNFNLSLLPLVDLNLPHDGESFNHEEPGECADWLEHLARLGYNVPEHAVKQLREEQVEFEGASA